MGPVINADHQPDGKYITPGDDIACAKGNGWEICPFTKVAGDADSYDASDGQWLGELFRLN